MLVAKIQVLMAVNIKVGGIVEYRSEIGRRNNLFAGAEQSLQGESAERKRGHNVLVGFVVGIAGNPVVGSGTVEFRKEQRLSLTVVESAGEKHAQALKLMAISRSALIGAKASGLERKLPILYLLGGAGNDVNDREKS